MTDQPVTPDREALHELVANAQIAAGVDFGGIDTALFVDALLPLLTDALDRAEKQGREKGHAEEREQFARNSLNAREVRPQIDESLDEGQQQ